MSLYNGPARGGNRGGKDQFNWDSVKSDKDREFYLGHSVKATTGRWQKGKDVFWYTREKQEEEAAKARLEMQAIKQREEDLMNEALGLKPKTLKQTAKPKLDSQDMAKLLGRTDSEEQGQPDPMQDPDAVKGLGYKPNMMTGVASAGHDVLGGIGVDEDSAAALAQDGPAEALPGPPPRLSVAELKQLLKKQKKAASKAHKEAKKAKKEVKKAKKHKEKDKEKLQVSQTSDGVGEVQAGLEHASIQSAEATDIKEPAVPEAAAAHLQQSPEVDLVAKIVKQVNFYFSNTNLPTDNFLLKEVRKTPEGWVPIRLIASFKRMKSLSKDIKVIAAALETSTELVVSGHRVRRKEPLPQVDETEALLRTAIVDNLPDQATIDSLTEKFSAAGNVKMVRICQPNSGPRSIAQSIPGADLAVSRQLHALIEFENQEQVATAVKQLTDSNNWRSGVTAETRAIASAQLQGNPDAADTTVLTQTGQPSRPGQPAAPGSTQPKMPDGSRGFSMGRGQPITAPKAL
ncbi:hypothetical protein WJX82_000772 [Trebouxia sp. C0006]